MRFAVNRAVLADALAAATSLINPRTPKPILSGVVLKAADGKLVVYATNLELFLTQTTSTTRDATPSMAR